MPQLSIIVPTFNEVGNVAELSARVAAVLPDVDWKLIFVDDNSPDDTAATVRELARTEPRVRCLHTASADADWHRHAWKACWPRRRRWWQ